jgi:hypothetical protein
MSTTIVIRAVSWKNRRAKVVNQWLPIYEDVNIRALEVGQAHEVELEKNLDGEWVIMKVLNGPRMAERHD